MKRFTHDADLRGMVVLRSLGFQLVPFKLHRFRKQRLGKPIVSTDCTGPKEALSNGEFGHLVPIANAQALADGLKMLLENDAIRERYAELSKQRSEFFSFERSMRDIETLLNT
ncbi:glycosyltransferase [Aeromonas salmonicida]|uniref:glycosyltransferase n=1 Tax=Aeromonas salmonicida TaxID=645 RepID=UPI001F3DCE94|nr:glycosyltransferase [Aeromonas salmonicida]